MNTPCHLSFVYIMFVFCAVLDRVSVAMTAFLALIRCCVLTEFATPQKCCKDP